MSRGFHQHRRDRHCQDSVDCSSNSSSDACRELLTDSQARPITKPGGSIERVEPNKAPFDYTQHGFDAAVQKSLESKRPLILMFGCGGNVGIQMDSLRSLKQEFGDKAYFVSIDTSTNAGSKIARNLHVLGNVTVLGAVDNGSGKAVPKDFAMHDFRGDIGFLISRYLHQVMPIVEAGMGSQEAPKPAFVVEPPKPSFVEPPKPALVEEPPQPALVEEPPKPALVEEPPQPALVEEPTTPGSAPGSAGFQPARVPFVLEPLAAPVPPPADAGSQAELVRVLVGPTSQPVVVPPPAKPAPQPGSAGFQPAPKPVLPEPPAKEVVVPEAPGVKAKSPRLSDSPALTAKLNKIAAALELQLHVIDHNTGKNVLAQGFLGKSADAIKNFAGTSGEGQSWYQPAALWSNLVDSSKGSNAVIAKLGSDAEQIDQMKQAANKGDTVRFIEIYEELTGSEFDSSNPVATLRSAEHLKAYDASQAAWVGGLADFTTAAVVAMRMRATSAATSTLMRAVPQGIVLGGITKASIMQVDGQYASLRRDLGAGAICGAIVPLGEVAGSSTSRWLGNKHGLTVSGNILTARIETQGLGLGMRFYSSAAKSGVSGAVFGGIDSPLQAALDDLEHSRPISPKMLIERSLSGAAGGFIGGTILGAAFDAVGDGFRTRRARAAQLIPPPGDLVSQPKTINGVQIPDSGVTTFDDAARILGVEPAEFATKAKSNPFGAVEDSVRLYNETGLNIKKADPLTGQMLVPAEFADALTTVQNVDAMTAGQMHQVTTAHGQKGTTVTLNQKIAVVKSNAEFLQNDAAQQAIAQSYQKLHADPNYVEVVRLQTEQSGPAAAAEFQAKFRAGFEKDLKTAMGVERVNDGTITAAESFGKNQPQTEAAYAQKAADFFKDMTDPAQRARLNSLVDDIFIKFNPENCSRDQLCQIIGGIAPADRELAFALLKESTGVASEVALKARLQAVQSDILLTTGMSSPANVYTLDAGSSGNPLGYLYRKSNSISMPIRNIDVLNDLLTSGNSPNFIVLFDDLSSTAISAPQRELLKKVPQIYVVDVGSFEKGINVFDMAKGTNCVAEKLQLLVSEARKVASANPKLIPTGVAREVLSGSFDAAAKALGPNVKVIRPTGTFNTPNVPDSMALAAMNPTDSLYATLNAPKATKAEIASFLSGYAGEEREIAARMLSEGAVHNSFASMIGKARTVHEGILESLSQSGMDLHDLRVVTDKDAGGSSHLISYLYARANGLSRENFISAKASAAMQAGGLGKGSAVALLDDTVYSGSQMSGLVDGFQFSGYKKIIVGSLGIFPEGRNRLLGTSMASQGKLNVISAGTHHSFYSPENSFFSQLSKDSQFKVKTIGGTSGWGDVQGSITWPHMYPDNNLVFFGPTFSGGVLRLPGP